MSVTGTECQRGMMRKSWRWMLGMAAQPVSVPKATELCTWRWLGW